jgi:hypothetical protein
MLPPEQRESKLEEFKPNKQKSLSDIVKNGKQAAANIEAFEKEISVLKEPVKLTPDQDGALQYPGLVK